jgi:hypothetical protein
LITFTASVAKSFVVEDFERLVLGVEDFGGLQESLSHKGFRYVGGLVEGHQVEVEEQFEVLVGGDDRVRACLGSAATVLGFQSDGRLLVLLVLGPHAHTLRAARRAHSLGKLIGPLNIY